MVTVRLEADNIFKGCEQAKIGWEWELGVKMTGSRSEMMGWIRVRRGNVEMVSTGEWFGRSERKRRTTQVFRKMVQICVELRTVELTEWIVQVQR